MNAEKLINKDIPLPIVGGVSAKDLMRFVVLSCGVGVSVYLLAKIPTVGAYVVTGWNKIKAWMV